MPSETSLLAGRYRLAYVLGSGGMGRVWRAYDETLHRPVAVKEVHLADDLSAREREALSERTMREARLTAQLNHPGVVATYDAVVEHERPFIVMELVAATNLADRVAEDGPLPAHEVGRVGSRLVEALAAAHRQGIAHRDVKPSNVLLADDGRVLLGDFGIATRDSDPSLTATGLLVGSPAYMAPERLRSERAGFAADVWSLGATLYTALEGGPPFRAETTIGTITAIMTDEIVPPRVEGPLADAVLGMLVKDPELVADPRPGSRAAGSRGHRAGAGAGVDGRVRGAVVRGSRPGGAGVGAATGGVPRAAAAGGNVVRAFPAATPVRPARCAGSGDAGGPGGSSGGPLRGPGGRRGGRRTVAFDRAT